MTDTLVLIVFVLVIVRWLKVDAGKVAADLKRINKGLDTIAKKMVK